MKENERCTQCVFTYSLHRADLPSSLMICSKLEGRSSRSEDLQEKKYSLILTVTAISLFYAFTM